MQSRLHRLPPILIGAASAAGAALVYRSNLRKERARWAESLYSRYFEKKELKEIRNTLDCEPEKDDRCKQEVAKLCEDATTSAKEGTNFTDYLNFFEFVAYLKKSGQLEKDDVDALFQYYLCRLNKHRCVVEFIDKYGFKNLKELLSNKAYKE